MTSPVYVTAMAAALPNERIGNEAMEGILGHVGGRPSRARNLVLRRNGIRSRHYAIDPATGKATHSNAQLTAEAVRKLANGHFQLEQMQLLACGTSSPDQFLPNHAVMVHGELGNPPCEVMASSGVCIAGVTSFKYGFMSVLAGLSDNAVVTGSELFSSFLRSTVFEAENEARIAALEQRPVIAFEKDFLRWMLSDGAGALLLQNKPRQGALSLRIEWIDQYSYANELEACMYAGAEKNPDGTLVGWRELGMNEVAARSVMSIRQDVRLLDEGIPKATRWALETMLLRRKLKPADVDWFLPHYSSDYFRPILRDVMAPLLPIPEERWFTNLSYLGNVGAAAPYLMLEELMASGRLKDGDRLLCYVPESGRFSMAFAYLTVVAG